MAEEYYACESNEHSFFWITPNVIDLMELDVYQYRLYSHFRRVAGNENGRIWESIATIARTCRMSRRQVIRAEKALIEKGLICIEKRSGETSLVKISDIWAMNHEFFQNNTSAYQTQGVCLPGTGGVPTRHRGCAYQAQGVCLTDTQIRKDNKKKDNKKIKANSDEEEEDDVSSSSSSPPPELKIPKKIELAFKNEKIGKLTISIQKEIINMLNDGIPINWIIKAIENAAAHNRHSWAYVRATLKNWRERGSDDDDEPMKAKYFLGR